MPITYRTLHPDEEEVVLDLWTAVLEDDRTVRRKVFHDFGADPRRFERTQVGRPAWVYISELGACPEEADALPALLTAVAEEAQRQGIAQGQLSLPHDLQLDRALAALFGPTLHEQAVQGTLMARAIAPHGDEQQLKAMFSARDGIFWELDRY